MQTTADYHKEYITKHILLNGVNIPGFKIYTSYIRNTDDTAAHATKISRYIASRAGLHLCAVSCQAKLLGLAALMSSHLAMRAV